MTGTQVEHGFVEPDYAGRSLGDVLPAVAQALGVPVGFHESSLALPPAPAYVVVLIDGYPQPPGPATEATDRVVRGAVQVVQSALRSGDRAGIVALGDRHPRWLGADIGLRCETCGRHVLVERRLLERRLTAFVRRGDPLISAAAAPRPSAP